MPFRVFVIALLTLLVACDIACASDDEIRQQRVLLVLEDFRQWTNLKYQFVDQQSDASKSSSHQFQETYNASLDGDIIGPHLFNANLSFSIGSDQGFFHTAGQSTNNDDSFRYTYQFTGTGLDRSITPFSLSSYRTSETVMSPFSPSYTSTTTGNEARVSLRNVLLPTSLTYARKTLDNTGGGYDSSTVSNSFAYNTSHVYKDLSSTGMTFTASQASGSFAGGTTQTARAYSASLTNTMQWGGGKKYSLSTVAQVYDTVDQSIPQRNVNISETFQDRLGKALDLQATYSYARNTTRSAFIDGDSQSVLNTAEVLLSHRLYDSVTTRLKAKYSHHDLLEGTELRYSGSAEMNYAKKLPGGNHLTVSTSGVHEVIDNHLGLSRLPVVGESYPDVHRGDVVTLRVTTGVLKSVDSVRSNIPIFTYVEGIDYTVDLARNQITIPQDSRIDPVGGGTELFISYTSVLAPLVKYASDSYNINSAISFGAGRYSVGASYMQQWMSPLSGSDQNSLRDSSLKMLYFNGNADALTYRVTLTDSDVGSLQSRSLDASAQYISDLYFGQFSLVGAERYSWYGASETLPSYGENTTTLSVSGVRGLSSNTRLTVSANWFDSRSDIRGAKDIATVRANLLYVLNKTMINLDGQSSWNITAGAVTRSDTFTIDFSRYF